MFTATLEKPKLTDEQIEAIGGTMDDHGNKTRHGIWDYLVLIFGDEVGGDPHFLLKFTADSEGNVLSAGALRQTQAQLKQCHHEGTKPEIPE